MTDSEGQRVLCVAAVSDNPNQQCRAGEPALARRGFLCAGHYRKLERLVQDAPNAVVWLRGNLTPGASHAEKVSGSKEDPAPLRVDVLDRADRIVDLLASWCRLVCEERDLTSAPTKPWAQASLLSTHLDWIVCQAWVDDLLDEFADAIRDAHTSAPWRPDRHRLGAPCPSCDAKALVRDDGDDHVVCHPNAGGCGRQWTELEYGRLTFILADEIKRGEHQEAS